MRNIFSEIILILVVVLLATGARAQEIPLKGTLGSTSVTAQNNSSVRILTAPATGHLVITAIYLSNEYGSVTGNTFGNIPPIALTPGLLMPPHERLTCNAPTEASYGAENCVLIWVLEK
jgi:hypothetical protein